MKQPMSITCSIFIFLAAFILPPAPAAAEENIAPDFRTALKTEIPKLMAKGNIPGLCIVIVNGGEPLFIRGFGCADLKTKTAVTPDTLFELASTSKAFTALAALECEAKGMIDLDLPVSRYLPWFYATYEGKKRDMTIRQLLHHTSGISTETLSRIPQSSRDDALEQTVRTIVGIELNSEPGTRFEYATINYDIIGAVIEAVSGMHFEEYMEKHILQPLNLDHTRVGTGRLQPVDNRHMAAGYKIGFSKPVKYEAPVYRGNTPAGYIISNGRDMARWLQLQLGLIGHELSPLIRRSQRRDTSVPPEIPSLLSYAMGWQVALDGSGRVVHTGLNPNFSAYVMFNPQKKTGVAVMANSNSAYTAFIGRRITDLSAGRETPMSADLDNGMDKTCSLLTYMLAGILFGILGFIIWGFAGILRGKRKFQPAGFKKILKMILPVFLLLPFITAVYFLPRALAGFSWEAALVWSPVSFKIAIALILAVMAAGYLAYLFSTLFPHRNEYVQSAPSLIVLSLACGGANAVIIFLITISLFNRSKVGYLLFYFGLAALLYVMGRKVLQTNLTKITQNIIYDLRMKLVAKLFYTSYQKFEKLESGRILATLNNDTGQIGNSANMIVTMISSVVTVIGAFIYLAAIAFWATIVTVILVALIAALYYIVSQKTDVYFNEARDAQNKWMDLLNGLQDGYKELSLHRNKKTSYRDDVETVCNRFRSKLVIAFVKFINAFMIGESMLIAILGAVGFLVPLFFPQIPVFTLMGFIMVLLYLIGPISGILGTIPGIMRIRISWQRVNGFMKDIPANMSPEYMASVTGNPGSVGKIEAKNVFFEYETENEGETFTVGPVNFKAEQGEIVFIIGGNGSGKTTLAKLLTGLYQPAKGTIKVDGEEIHSYRLGEYFSVVFGDYHLFEKLYDVDISGKKRQIEDYLEMLRLQDKVKLEGDAFSTVELSGGQRKRLALLRCYLEDRPIYLFDEVAADQDPEFRKFFYRDLLSRMKQEGKIVIAITHDDHYFDVADRVIKMDMGKIEFVEQGAKLTVTK